MGYLKVNTDAEGEVIVDASKITVVKLKSATRITFVLESACIGDIKVAGTNFTESTKQKFNQAVIDAQSAGAVVVAPSGTESFSSITVDPV